MTDYGLIQDMGWLSNYRAVLNGEESIVILGLERGEPCISWHGAWIWFYLFMILVVRAKVGARRCMELLASVVNITWIVPVRS